MAHYEEVTYHCGHVGQISIAGSRKIIEWRKKQCKLEICPECLKELHRKEAEAAAEKAEKQELPKLIGSPKQVQWAEQLRMKMINEIDRFVAERLIEMDQSKPEVKKEVELTLGTIHMIKHEQSAKFWIDSRNDASARYFVMAHFKEYAAKYQAAQAAPTDVKEPEDTEKKSEAVSEEPVAPAEPADMIKPLEVKHKVPVKITVSGDEVHVVNPEYSEDFRSYIKSCNFTWSKGLWVKSHASVMTNAPEDGAAEIAYNLLAKGYIVMIANHAVRDKVINQSFKSSPDKMIVSRNGKLCVWWSKAHDFFRAAKLLPKATWEKGAGMIVEPEYYESVIDFAKLNNFEFSPGAKELIENQKQNFENAAVVNAEEKEIKFENGLPSIPKLKAEKTEIAESLKDKE